MRVNTSYDIKDLNEFATNPVTQPYFSTFLHEYVHFLQDVTSISGLLNSIFYIDMLKDVIGDIRNNPSAQFKVPCKITNTNNIEVNLKLRKLYRGEGEGHYLVKYDHYTEEKVMMIDNAGTKIYPVKYRVYFHDLKTRTPGSIDFGYLCLKEYVTHSVQKQLIPSTEHSDIPYTIAEQIAIKECPSFSDPKLIMALCDAALMSYHPAQTFFITLDRLKKENKILNTPLEVYDYTTQLEFGNDYKRETVDSLFEKTFTLANEQLKDALKSDLFSPNYSWVSHVLREAKELRLSNPDFMTQLVLPSNQIAPICIEIFRKLGTPFFTNKSEKGMFIPPHLLREETAIAPYQLMVFKEILSVLNGKSKCDMYGFCKTRPDKDITNADCISSPWNRVKEPELCPFAQLWKTWGLADKYPVP